MRTQEKEDDMPSVDVENLKKTIGRRAIIVAVLVLLLALVLGYFIFTSSSCSRQISRFQAEYGHGTERVVTLYSATGEQLDQWEGIIDVEYIDDRVDLIFFNRQGGVIDRVIINPGSATLVVDQV